MSTEIRQSTTVRILTYVVAAILVLVPFHAVITTWLGSNFDHIDLFRIWKELLLIPLTFITLYVAYRDNRLKQWLQSDRLVLIILLYTLLHITLGLWAYTYDRINTSALIFALLINLRFLAFFLICFVVAARSSWLRVHWQKLLLWPAAIVIIFGLLQQFVLPANVLSHVGYGPDTIPAYQTIDQKPDFVRTQSTLRGPNPLGAYLLLVITALSGLWLVNKQRKLSGLALTIAATAVLFFTYSRSAWLGLIVSLAFLVYWSVKNPKFRRLALLTATIAILILGSLVLALRDNNALQNTLFHTDETSRSAESSNAVRTQAISDGARSVIREPFGRGPGTAGSASFRNSHPPRITENYFIQIGQEVGILGLTLFIAINILVAKALWRQRQQILAKVLWASLAGITLVNLLSHAWPDDTLAYIWWGLAGIALGSAILNKKRKRNETQAAATS